MPPNKSPMSFGRLREVLDKALAAENGIRIKRLYSGAAVNLRQRLYQARNSDRVKNREIYPPGHHLHGYSVYDVIAIKIEEDLDNNCWWVIVNKGDEIEVEVL